MNNSKNEKNNLKGNARIYYEVKSNFNDQIIKIKDQLEKYDKRTENLHNKTNDLIMKYCNDLYQLYSNEHKDKHISFEDNSTESSRKFKACKKYYTHDVVEYIQYNKNYFSKIESDFKGFLDNCDYENNIEQNDNNLKKCYSEAFQNYMVRMKHFLNTNADILPKKEMYIYKIMTKHLDS